LVCQILILRNKKILKKEKKDKIMDTYRGMLFDEFVNLFLNNGFKIIFEEESDYEVIECSKEKLVVMLSDEVLLSAWSWHGKISKSTVYYNWKPSSRSVKEYLDKKNDDFSLFRLTSTGGFHVEGLAHEQERLLSDTDFFHKAIWVGSYSGIDNILDHLNELRKHGKFIMPFKIKGFVWLLNSNEEFDYPGGSKKYVEITERKLKKAGFDPFLNKI